MNKKLSFQGDCSGAAPDWLKCVVIFGAMFAVAFGTYSYHHLTSQGISIPTAINDASNRVYRVGVALKERSK